MVFGNSTRPIENRGVLVLQYETLYSTDRMHNSRFSVLPDQEISGELDVFYANHCELTKSGCSNWLLLHLQSCSQL